MRDDFAVFILSHGRPDKVHTMRTLRRGNYTGKFYIVVDNEDDQYEKYEKTFGNEHVIMFDKSEVMRQTDTMDTFGERRAVIFARNACFQIAQQLGLKFFLELDDDYTSLLHRFPEGNQLKSKKCMQIDRLFEDMIQFLMDTNALTVAFCQSGDFIGGVQSERFHQHVIRKAMNTFFCRADRPFHFLGTINEDVTMYTTLGSRGELILSITDVAITQV